MISPHQITTETSPCPNPLCPCLVSELNSMAAFSLRWMSRCQMVLESAVVARPCNWPESPVPSPRPIANWCCDPCPCDLQLGSPVQQKNQTTGRGCAPLRIFNPTEPTPFKFSHFHIHPFTHSHLTTEPYSCCVPFQPGLAAVDALSHLERRIASHHVMLRLPHHTAGDKTSSTASQEEDATEGEGTGTPSPDYGTPIEADVCIAFAMICQLVDSAWQSFRGSDA
jgi:hypothetical protein